MRFNNKKGDLVIDSLLIILLLVLFFLLVDPLQTVTNEMTAFANDDITLWMLRAFPFLILVGIIKYVMDKSRAEQ